MKKINLILLLLLVCFACGQSLVNVEYRGQRAYSIDNIPFETLQNCQYSKFIVDLTDKILLVWIKYLKIFDINSIKAAAELTNIRVCLIKYPETTCCGSCNILANGCGWFNGFWIASYNLDNHPYNFETICDSVTHELTHVIAARFQLNDNAEHNTFIWKYFDTVKKQACKK